MLEEAKQHIQEAKRTGQTSLDLSRFNLTELPDEIGDLTALTELNLRLNRLTSLPESIGNLTALVHLDLVNNQLTALPESIGELNSLTDLALWGNRLTTLPKSFGNLTALARLDLSGNRLTELPNSIGNLTGLTLLDLVNNQLANLPESVGNLSALIELELWGNQLTSLPESIGNLTQLTQLDLSANQLTSLPDSVGNLTGLIRLDLRANHLACLPESVGNLTDLTQLDLSQNNLTGLPESIGRLTALTNLSLFRNSLLSLPESIGNLSRILQLDLTGHHLTALPESIGGLSALTRLALAGNRLEAVPESIGNLTGLTQLDLSNHRLSELPESIGNLTGLTRLDLSRNHLTALPESIGGLSALTHLALAGNRLEAVPESIGNLTGLTQLDLSNHRLSELPESIGNLTGLTQLDISGNRLTALPQTVKNLTALTFLDLRDNRLTTLPEQLSDISGLVDLMPTGNPLPPEMIAAIGSEPDGLKAFLMELARNGVLVREAKLVLVGEGAVGKSTLLNAMLGGPFDPNRSSTHGVEVKPLVLSEGTTDECVLNGWDFGGQPTYRPTHQLFFTSPAIYLVVWNPRHGPQKDNVDEWIELIRRRAGDDVRIHVVATHGGPKHRFAHIDETQIRQKHGDVIVDFHHVDSETGTGIEELKAAVQVTASDLPHFTRKLPANWLQFQQDLRESSGPYLDYEQYLAHAARYRITEESAHTLARIATDLGYWCYYPEIPGLDHLVVLKGDWLSAAVSLVIDDPQTVGHHGLVEHARLKEIWDNPGNPPELRYPDKVHPVLLRLMEEYGISYRVSEERGTRPPTSLIAQLVDPRTPDLSAWAEYKPELPHQTRICKFSDASGNFHIPKGLIYGLIVRLHRFSMGREHYPWSVHWTSGLMVDYDLYGRALLQIERNQITVTVKAAFPQLFLTLIIDDVRRHVSEFWQGVKIHDLVPCGSHCVDPRCSREGQWEIERLQNRRSKGKSDITCPSCDEDASIEGLMYGVSVPSTPGEDLVRAVNETLAPRFNAMLDQIRAEGELTRTTVSTESSRAIAQGESYLQDILKAFNDEAAHGPRLFTLEEFSERSLPNLGFVKRRLVLWCEHSRMPLRVLNNDPESGVYEVSFPQEWLVKAAPWVNAVSRLLKVVLPVALDGVKLELGDQQWKTLEEQLTFTRSAIGGVAEVGELVTGQIPTDHRLRHGEPTNDQLRTLHEILRKQDPDFGGLVRVLDRGRFLWVHPQYEQRFNPGLPDMGGAARPLSLPEPVPHEWSHSPHSLPVVRVCEGRSSSQPGISP